MSALANPIVIEDLRQIHAGIERRRGRLDGATVLITGCAGFLGFYLLHYLVGYAKELGLRRVIGLDTFLLERPQWLERLNTEFPRILELHACNVATDDLGKIAGAADAEFVVHLASIASPTYYRRYPVETIDANVWGLRRLLEACRGSRTLRGLLFFSSSEIYGDPAGAAIPTAEDYRGNVACVGPRACYDEAKRFGETVCYVFARAHGMPITIVRPFNNYGPGMRAGDGRLPADFARAVMNGEDLVIFSDGSPTRTFCYVADAIGGYLLGLLHGEFDYFNIGIEKPEIRVDELAELYRAAGQEVFGYRGRVRFEQNRDADYLSDNPHRRCPIIAKARRRLGYDPLIPVEQGVRRYLSFLAHERAAGA